MNLSEIKLAKLTGTDSEIETAEKIRAEFFEELNLQCSAKLAYQDWEGGAKDLEKHFAGKDRQGIIETIFAKFEEMAAITSAAWWVKNYHRHNNNIPFGEYLADNTFTAIPSGEDEVTTVEKILELELEYTALDREAKLWPNDFLFFDNDPEAEKEREEPEYQARVAAAQLAGDNWRCVRDGASADVLAAYRALTDDARDALIKKITGTDEDDKTGFGTCIM